MKKNNIYKISVSSVFAAVIFISTTFTRIPIPFMGNGYFNLGDCFIILAGILLGPLWGGLSAAAGAGISDLLGYPAYFPATLAIKFLMAITVFYIFKAFKNSSFKFSGIGFVLAALVAESIMVLGYFLFEWLLYGNVFMAVASIIGNILQGVCSIVSAFILFSFIKKTGLKTRIFKSNSCEV